LIHTLRSSDGLREESIILQNFTTVVQCCFFCWTAIISMWAFRNQTETTENSAYKHKHLQHLNIRA